MLLESSCISTARSVKLESVYVRSSCIVMMSALLFFENPNQDTVIESLHLDKDYINLLGSSISLDFLFAAKEDGRDPPDLCFV